MLVEGNGEIPTSDKQVRVHYHGELTDGTVFDSSVSRGQPAEFPVTGVIKVGLKHFN
ncbi:FKBP-type peptidyl-prolyl cis-trans isomerase fklB [Vibrio sp. JCM 19236]|nr:FKBP-type peptidyl-prolyl cis-trans isomerase fklB [Vibrio sp. JCM 19236]